MSTTKIKSPAPDPKHLSEIHREFYQEAVRLYHKGIDWFEFWNFAFGFGSPLYQGVRLRSDVLNTPLEQALRSMWLELGVRQGMVKPEQSKRAARRK